MSKEVWKDIKGYEGLYQVSNIGRVKSLPKEWVFGNGGICKHYGLILKDADSCGYRHVSLCKNGKVKTHNIHRLILLSFLGESDLQVNHINGDKSDNRLENLEYCTPSENAQHSYDTGLQIAKRGSDLSFSKLTESQVFRIKYIAAYMKPRRGYWTQIAKSLNISTSVISNIIHNKKWKHVKV